MSHLDNSVDSHLQVADKVTVIGVGDTYTITKDVDYATISDAAPKFESQTPTIATVDPQTGAVKALKSGDARIKISLPDNGLYLDASAIIDIKVRVQNTEQFYANVKAFADGDQILFAEGASIEMKENIALKGKAYIVGDKNKPATIVVTKQFTFDNDFEISNVVLDFTGQTNDFLKFVGEAEELTKFEGVKLENVKAFGMKKCLFNMNSKQKYLMNNFSVINCVIEMTAAQPIINFKSSGCAYNINIDKSTMYCSSTDVDNVVKKALPYTSQTGKGITELDENGKQTFNITNSTFYNLSKTANFFTLAKNSQKWLVFNVNNNIFVDCGKTGQTIIGINQGQQSDNPTWAASGNVINFGGEDKSATEKNPYKSKANPIVESIAKVVAFKDAANGDFTQSDANAGDPRWIKK